MRKLIFLFTLLVLVGCTNNKTSDQQSTEASEVSDAVEVVYFHGKMKCKTCVAIGSLSQEIVGEISDEGIVWKEVDHSTAEGSKFADKHELLGSGLIVVSNHKSDNLTQMAFRYALSDTAKFRSELVDAINKIKE